MFILVKYKLTVRLCDLYVNKQAQESEKKSL